MTLTLTSISQPGRGALYIISAGLLFAGANSAVQAAGMWYGVPSPTIAFWQYAAALVAVMPLLAKGSLRSAQPGWHVLRIAAAAIGVQFWVAGLAVVPIWQAIALILTSPLFVTIGAMMFLGERGSPTPTA